MLINGVELSFDIMDADVLEQYEKQLNTAMERTQQRDMTQPAATIIRYECETVRQFFDALFGEGTSQQIFGDKDNMRICLDAFEKVVAEVAEQTKTLNQALAAYSVKTKRAAK